ncbi:MAG: urate hydroxylase PuuD [Microvirga sp.]|nr:urate hydroxylase PuuD [Microvirga sp.]
MIDPALTEWTSQLLRWLHVITAIAWIGSSFYFIMLDLSLKKREAMPPGVGGEAWQVHGGGFYHMRKYMVAPAELPTQLTWFKWESYATWISGFFLLVWVYYVQAELYTVDPSVTALAPWQAAAIGIGALVGGWFIYDGLCKSPLGRNDLALGLVLFGLILLAAWFFFQVFSPRAAYLHTGALIGTWMSGSVFRVIIPNQKIVVADLIAGRTPDPALGKQAKQRSLHNNYLTLPVIFLMLSNHYPLAWSGDYAIAIIALVLLTGASIRHFFNTHHAHGEVSAGTMVWTWGAAAACMALAVWLSIAGKPSLDDVNFDAGMAPAELRTPLFEEATLTLQGRCVMCHASEPFWPGIASAPKGVKMETETDILRHASQIRVHSVDTRSMPPNNITEMTLAERRLVAEWLAEYEAVRRGRGG